jgi:tetratricopeptide (TPR) repeat protein
MSGTPLQLGLFGGPPTPFHPEPVVQKALPVEPEETLVLEGQLALFEGLSAHRSRVAQLVRLGQFQEALSEAERVAANHQEALSWCSVLRAAAREIDGAREDPDALARVVLSWSVDRTDTESAGVLSLAILRGLHWATAAAADRKGPGTTAGGRLAGWHWAQAGRLEEARRSLESGIAAGRSVGPAFILLGNLAHQEGDAPRARAFYRRALLLDPQGVEVAEIADEGVRELVDETVELELSPTEAWMPIVGSCTGVLAPGTEKSANEAVALFQTLLERSRHATQRGTPDVNVRRELKTIAPALFPLLRDSGLL